MEESEPMAKGDSSEQGEQEPLQTSSTTSAPEEEEEDAAPVPVSPELPKQQTQEDDDEPLEESASELVNEDPVVLEEPLEEAEQQAENPTDDMQQEDTGDKEQAATETDTPLQEDTPTTKEETSEIKPQQSDAPEGNLVEADQGVDVTSTQQGPDSSPTPKQKQQRDAADDPTSCTTTPSSKASESDEPIQHAGGEEETPKEPEQGAPSSNISNESTSDEQQYQESQAACAPSLLSVESMASASEVPNTGPMSLEECLYGDEVSQVPEGADNIKNNSEQQQQQEDDHQFVFHDEWDMLRPPGLWKQSNHIISLPALRKIASQAGFPDEGTHRAVAWRVMLGYLPPNCSEWDALLKEKRELYRSFVHDWFQDVPDCDSGEALRWKRKIPNRGRRTFAAGFAKDDEGSSSHASLEPINLVEGGPGDLSNTDGSASQRLHGSSSSDIFLHGEKTNQKLIPSPIKAQWNERSGMTNSSVLERLMKRNMNKLQVKELLEVPFSNSKDGETASEDEVGDACFRDVAESAKLLDEIRKDVVRTFPDLSFFLDPDDSIGKRRYAAMERILFVWSKYNKGVRYVQGMNEIVGTIYYVLANDWNQEWAAEAEADTYWLFHSLLLDMRDVFVPDLDEADTGIQGRIHLIEKLLERHDPEVKEHLDVIGVECSFFAIRWWTTLLTREFLLPDTIRLWDSMFASTHKDNFLCYVCVTMVILIREDLLKGDFSRCLRLLQSYPPVLMDQLLDSSRALWVYERQITMACHKGGISLHQALQAVPPPDTIVMAFGFRKGVVPKTRAAQLEEASGRAAVKVREATAVVAEKASGWFGRASRLVSRYRSQSSESLQSMMSGKSSQSSKHGADEALVDDESDSIYMSAIESADAGKWSYTSK